MTTILVTGANRGIGLALARCYGARGDTVIAVTRSGKAPDAAGKGELITLPADVTDEKSLSKAAATLGDRAVDVVICNAGMMSSRGGIAGAGHDAAEWSRVLMTNVAGVFLTVRAFLPAMQRAKSGKLAVISSMMGSSQMAAGDAYAYRATKAAAANLGANFAVELKPQKIAVGIYHPGWVATDMGGKTAPVTPDDSAAGLVARIDKLSLATTGVFEDYQGKPYAF